MLLLSSLKVPDEKFCIVMRDPTGGTAGGLMLYIYNIYGFFHGKTKKKSGE